MSSEAILNISVDELAIPLSAHNRLKENGVVQLGDLVQKTGKELLYIRGFGKRSLNNVKVALSRFGLELGMTISDWPKLPSTADHTHGVAPLLNYNAHNPAPG